jgi:hypothetical protein
MVLRAEPGKQKPRSCRTQELARSSAQENERQKKAGLPDSTKVSTTDGRRQHARQKKRSQCTRAGVARWNNCTEARGQYRIVGTGQSEERTRRTVSAVRRA